MKDNRPRIMIVDDESLNIDTLVEILGEEYKTVAAKTGEQALKRISKHPPDLILLDIMMPGMDGYAVCRQLKSDPTLAAIPVIFVTAKNETEDEAKGFELGAVDYITKPFSQPIVKARIKTHLTLKSAMEELKRLYKLALDTNPLSGLPGNNSVAATITNALENKESVCVIYTDLDNFKAFNDKYGFANGDEVILFTSRILQQSVQDVECPDAFVGHIGGDDFVLVVPSDRYNNVANQIARLFDSGIVDFYNEEDRLSKSISSINRQGNPEVFPIMSISMAGVDLALGVYNEYIKINDVCAELKKKSKTFPGSSFCIDKRTV